MVPPAGNKQCSGRSRRSWIHSPRGPDVPRSARMVAESSACGVVQLRLIWVAAGGVKTQGGVPGITTTENTHKWSE